MNIKRSFYPLSSDINNLFSSFLKNYGQDDASFVETSMWAPEVDIKEEKDCFKVYADIPGVKKDDIHIALENNILTIKGERSSEIKEEKDGYSRIERKQGQFYRHFSLPQTADETQISASYKQGVLEVTIPKKPTATQKRIEISEE